jgi:hypothetical protein
MNKNARRNSRKTLKENIKQHKEILTGLTNTKNCWECKELEHNTPNKVTSFCTKFKWYINNDICREQEVCKE